MSMLPGPVILGYVIKVVGGKISNILKKKLSFWRFICLLEILFF